MQTLVLPPDEQTLKQASSLLRAGEVVAFPTETVYGLGANALDPEAVLRIFTAKERPADNPLIVHIWSLSQLDGLVEIPELAHPLMERFWPGPLTLLMPKTKAIPEIVTAGLDTVAIRMPSHPVAQSLLKTCDLPIAAPSANRSGRPSPTAASHVLEDMNGRIPLIIDGGDCAVGVESTVLDICHGTPCILRPGGVTRDMLQDVIGLVDVAGSVLRPLREGETARSPGMRYRHYAPKGQVSLVTGRTEDVIAALRKLYEAAAAEGRKACVMCFQEHADALSDCNPHVIGHAADPSTVAHRLFSVLRQLDHDGMEVVYSEVLPPEGYGLAVMNRLGRAAAFRMIPAAECLREQDPLTTT